MTIIIQCVPNFSEGNDIKIIQSIIDASHNASSAKIADYSWDRDHNRLVLSLIGNKKEIYNALISSVGEAIQLIDLRKHKGAHPRIGAVDVIPLVPIRNITMEECVSLSYEIGNALSSLYDLPVYYYEKSSLNPKHKMLPDIRKGGYEYLKSIELIGDRKPDIGPNRIHPSAGAAVIGARKPLVAYNINLDTEDISLAKYIISEIRKHKEMFPGLKLLAVHLESKKQTQISMNITDLEKLNIYDIFNFIKQKADQLDVLITESEIIGLISKKYFNNMNKIKAFNFKKSQFIENWL